jgi:hypothetical protein
VNENNDLIATLNANGNDLGIVDVSVYENNGPVRTTATGTKLLDRNITIRPQFQPTTPVSLRLYITNQELMALRAADPTVSGPASLMVSKTTDSCVNGQMPGAGMQVAQIANGSYGSDHYIDVAISSFSNFYVHSSSAALPVTLLSFTAERFGNLNKLRWSTATEINNAGFEIERSYDGQKFTKISYTTTKANNGNSTSLTQYEYNDERRTNGNTYYRIRQVDKDGKGTLSNVVLIKGKVDVVSLIRLYPNPAREKMNVVVATPGNEKINIVITDLAGKIVSQQQVQSVAGENLVSVNTSRLTGGSYLLKVVCNNGCESAISKFIKE